MKSKYYVISKNIFLVDGKAKSCIYDLNNRKLYQINHNLSQLIKRYCENPNQSFNREETEIINQLEKKEIKLDNCNSYNEKNSIIVKNQIEFAWIEVCTTCNLKCIHCYNESDNTCTKMMSYEDFVLVADTLSKMNIKKIQFIGGEPLIIGEDLKRMIEYASSKFDSIEVFTNGTLINESWTEFFKEHNIKLALSVYSYIKEEHEKVTKTKGSFERTNKAILRLRESNIQYRVCNTIMDQVKIGEKNSDLYTLSTRKDIVRMSGRGNLHLLNEELIKKKLITKDYFSGPLNVSMTKRLINAHNCFSSKIYISTDLTVYPCVMERRFSHGKITKNEDFNLDISITKFTKDNIKGCKECEFKYCCFDCRPDSLSDDIYEKPWYCTYHPETGSWDTVEETLNRIIDKDNTYF